MEILEKEKKRVEVPRKSCPICNRPTFKAVCLSETDSEADSRLWFFCLCGILFQEFPPKKIKKDKLFIDRHDLIKEYEDISVHAPKVYASILEELTYGRKFIDIGFGTMNVINFMQQRGWVCYGLDSNKDIEGTDRIIRDDFETTDMLYKKTFDVVWMSQVLENFHNPVLALKKCYEILQENGVLYISTADADFLYTDPQRWPHWNSKENYIIWTIRALCLELEKIGFEVIYKFRNYHSRFGYYHNIHIIAQKIHY